MDADSRGGKARKGSVVNTAANASSSGPTTFFLKTEREMEKTVQRGRKPSRGTMPTRQERETPLVTASISDSTFGVQSLEETINAAFSSDSDLSRTSSHTTDQSPSGSKDGEAPIGRKRRAGNPVHPKIRSAGQRIISSDYSPKPAHVAASPVSARSAESPFPTSSLTRVSTASSGLNQPYTPVKMSPHPQYATPSPIRSASSRSFRLSDEEARSSDETGSQAVLSSNEDGEDFERTPQLVMPSLAMPTRRPFTEHGRSMGRLKVMVIGARGVGKTSLIHSILRSSEHIVHADLATANIDGHQSLGLGEPTTTFVEVSASTKPCPTWWSELAPKKGLNRRLSTGDVLERNLAFIDTPPIDNDDTMRHTSDYLKSALRRSSTWDDLNDSEIVGMLSGDGGAQIDVVLHIFDCTPKDSIDAFTPAHQELLQLISRQTNLIPVIGRADQLSPEALRTARQSLAEKLAAMHVEWYRLAGGMDEPFAISAAQQDDRDVIDASLLMSSQYMPALMASDLESLTASLFSHINMARLRRSSASKVLEWRKGFIRETRLQLQTSEYALSSHGGQGSAAVTSAGSMREDPSKILVPYGFSSYYRSISPSVSEISGLPSSVRTFGLQHNHSDGIMPLREITTAKWAQDLEMNHSREGRKLFEMYNHPPSDWSPEQDPEKTSHQALVPAHELQRPARGRLGGDFGVIDPRDPLGVLAITQGFGRRSYLALQIASGCGLLGAMCYCVIRYWTTVQEVCGFGQAGTIIHAAAIPAPSRSTLSGLDGQIRALFGWAH